MEKIFENIEVAYQYKSLKELKHTYWFYNYFFKSWIIQLAKKFFILSLILRIPIKWLVKPTIYKLFCAGETLQEAITKANKLSEFNVKVILDYAAEEAQTVEEAEKNYKQIVEVINVSASNSFIAFNVFKPTALCNKKILEKKSKCEELSDEEKDAFDKFRFFVDDLCNRSYRAHVPILIDAEYVSVQDAVDAIAWEMMKKYNKQRAIVFNTLQMYRKDRLQYLKNLSKAAEREEIILGIKLVRGAYLEQERLWAKQKGIPSPVFDTKIETDENYNKALKYCLENISKIAVFSGTHNEESNYLMLQWMKEFTIEHNNKHVYSSQLYGMSDHISFNLAKLGYNVAKYMPFGSVTLTIPYLLRRADENKSIRNQKSRELELIKKAIYYKKNKKHEIR
ncbi:MAG: proline dehydrogenase family protein [Bacteroidales bacterium]|nr:proline dehydrogenase family protein [Bacteroidales bacterium]